ncbi:FtsK/SpoIIIE family DNA translocase [Lederbergia citrea]|uniref:DNA translocase FtsK n=1 Tax=Lederbergia citrea TaxID=2833581 RepID=A0A942UJ95_9BACI|nr:DNA translocase FtsK [Lederbergia citrea]MBS4221690.1 DNA translocase FtsK [Lederbergia citrea]
MAKKKKRRSRNTKRIKKSLQFEISGIILIPLCLISIFPDGMFGNNITFVFYWLLGSFYLAVPLTTLLLAVYFIIKRNWPQFFSPRLIGMYIIVAVVLLLSHINMIETMIAEGKIVGKSVFGNTLEMYKQVKAGEETFLKLGSGMVGAVLYSIPYMLFGPVGTKLLSYFLVLIGIILITGKSIGEVLEKVGKKLALLIKKQWQEYVQDMKEWRTDRRARAKLDKKQEKKLPSQTEEIIEVEEGIPQQSLADTSKPIISSFTEKAYPVDENEAIVNEVKLETTTEDEELVPPMTFTEHENKDYDLPPLSLLTRPGATDQSSEYKLIHENTTKLNKTFQSFGVKARVTQVHLGPAVTKYEVHPEAGVKVSRIVSLSDDIALALAAKGIRIEAPIPGKSAIGIEVPNTEIAVVSLREVLDSKQNDKPDAKLQIALGRDITGQAVVAEMNKMPHLLVAGATGSGKSVCINGIITSILMRAKPHEVKMMMIDPKMVELNVYNGIPHLLAPVVTDPKKASQALKKVVNEMERRYELFSHTGTRNIEGYNDYVTRFNSESEEIQPLLPYIVVIVDELADLMMVASNDVEDSITRLAQMARAAGIHLIIATQRPSVDVITGVIKANIPSRIAFAVSSAIDSRTILDTGGAEKLLGRGDMLFMPVGASKPVRVQGAFLSDQEVEEVVDFVIAQQKAQYQEEMIPDDIPEVSTEVEDDLYEEAIQLIAEMQTASVSMLQRRFRIGYTRAARLIDEMEARGVVGPYEGSKPRTVLVPKPAEEQMS